MIRVALAVLLTAMVALPAVAAPTPGTVLVLGDSYASGEGLATAEGECGRETERSWGALLAAELGADLRLLACSGAEVADVTVGGPLGRPAQLAEASPAELVVLTLSGNDLGFVEIVADCLGFAQLEEAPTVEALEEGGWTALLAGGSALDRGCDVTGDELLARIAGFGSDDRFLLDDEGSTGALADVYVTVARAAVADGGRLLVVGYPALVADAGAWPDRYVQRCHGLRAEDATALVPVIEALDEQIAGAAAAANDLLGDEVVQHVSVLAAVDGTVDGSDHRLCGGGEPWINGLTLVEGGVNVAQLLSQLGAGTGGLDLEAIGARPQGSFHPSTAGHAGIAATVLDDLRG